jgi:predicted ferric reductase
VTGYEVFRKAHYVLAMVYIGAAIGHWGLLQCFLFPASVLWLADRAARAVRTALLHYGVIGNATAKLGFAPARVTVSLWRYDKNGDAVRLDWDHAQRSWAVEQHFFLCFVEASVWQSHPFTPLSLPVGQDDNSRTRHSCVMRAQKGEAKRLADLVRRKLDAGENAMTEIILQGPYGTSIVDGTRAGHGAGCRKRRRCGHTSLCHGQRN